MTGGSLAVALLAVTAASSALALTAPRLHANDNLPSLEGWALADRGLGCVWTWLLLGGTVYTAYTFTAVPGLVYSTGAPAFFAVPYTIVVWPLAFVLLPRLWSVARRDGYTTSAEFVRARYGSPALALVVALTGILATMPYLALQLLGIRTVLASGGLPAHGAGSDVAMTVLFAGLAVSTYRHGLRAPTIISALKGVAIFTTVGALCWLTLHRTGGSGAVFAAASRQLAHNGAGSHAAILTAAQQPVFATLAVGSALALLMYPHVLTVAFAASGPDTLRRVCVALPAWTGVLALFGLLGLGALAAGIRPPSGGAELAVPLLARHLLPGPLAGLVFGAIIVGALVPAAVMSIAAATSFVRDVHVAHVHPTATPKRQVRVARIVSLIAKVCAVAFVLGLRDQDAINLQLLGGIWILQVFPSVGVGLFTGRPHPLALLAGWATGMVSGTVLAVREGFSPVVPLSIPGLAAHSIGIYAGLAALLLNLAVTALGTLILERTGVPRGADTTSLPLRLILRRCPETGASAP